MNRQQINESRMESYHKHSDSINRLRRKHPEISGKGSFNRLNPTHFDFGASNRKPPGESSFARLVRQYAKQARHRDISYCLSISDVRNITSSKCHYCGVAPSQTMQSSDSNGSYIYNGIDRVDPTLGYTLGNCVPACKTCNYAKRDMSPSAWDEWLGRVTRFRIAGNVGFKKTLEKDDEWKGKRQ